ncbi:MAG: hypothetical protein QM765_20495 [Myxococcales bacterium]
MRSSFVFAAVVILSAACGDCGGVPGKPDASFVPGTCDLPNIDPKCGSACTGDSDCPSSLYCLSKKCVADCVGVGTACGPGGRCADRGRCVLPGGDGGVFDPDAGDCPRVKVTATELVPTVQLLVDRSGSMGEEFVPGTSRWSALKTALVDPSQGVVTRLQSKVRFGATLYTNDGQGTCPDLQLHRPQAGKRSGHWDAHRHERPWGGHADRRGAGRDRPEAPRRRAHRRR